jgi:5-methylcytosine-specific restriction endonuclease McrA
MVFVLSSDKKPLNPCNPARARILLKQGKACVFKQYPFTIILKSRWSFMSETDEFRLKIDPGSKVTGIAIINETTGKVVWAGEVQHRGYRIKEKLESRSASRRSRRNRHTRYRQARWMNRVRQGQMRFSYTSRKGKGWLPPSLCSRIFNVETWIRRLMKLCPIKAFSLESVKFDTQIMENPEIEGIEYQRGTLYGYELKEYLLEKWGHSCVYCGEKDVPLQIEHIKPKSMGGTNRVSNLTIACEKCNIRKNTMTVEEFLEKDRVARNYQAQLKKEHKSGFFKLYSCREFLKDVAAVNSTRKALYQKIKIYNLPIECGSGGLTKYNRVNRGLEKTHWIDALCVGKSTPDVIDVMGITPLNIKAVGHGSRQMCSVDKYGFPASKAKAGKKFFGYQTHDIVKSGNNIGRIKGVRKTGSFTMEGKDKDLNVSQKKISLTQHADGYSYR